MALDRDISPDLPQENETWEELARHPLTEARWITRMKWRRPTEEEVQSQVASFQAMQTSDPQRLEEILTWIRTCATAYESCNIPAAVSRMQMSQANVKNLKGPYWTGEDYQRLLQLCREAELVA
ncbi:MAG: hypothetical protein WC777_06110 [Candidatus Gracilibacteria bacterium]|jgi:hypothetical protein